MGLSAGLATPQQPNRLTLAAVGCSAGGMNATKNRRKITPQSRLLARGCIDGRSREGRFLAACRHELAQHCGGNPSPTQRVLIDRLAWLRLHVLLIDERVAGGKPMTFHDQRAYLAFSNSISRGMRTLGLEEPTRPRRPKPKTFTDYADEFEAAE
jgi:hypothetical protein